MGFQKTFDSEGSSSYGHQSVSAKTRPSEDERYRHVKRGRSPGSLRALGARAGSGRRRHTWETHSALGRWDPAGVGAASSFGTLRGGPRLKAADRDFSGGNGRGAPGSGDAETRGIAPGQWQWEGRR